METIKISEETLRGLYLILCGLPFDHSGAEVYDKLNKMMEEGNIYFEHHPNLDIQNMIYDLEG